MRGATIEIQVEPQRTSSSTPSDAEGIPVPDNPTGVRVMAAVRSAGQEEREVAGRMGQEVDAVARIPWHELERASLTIDHKDWVRIDSDGTLLADEAALEGLWEVTALDVERTGTRALLTRIDHG